MILGIISHASCRNGRGPARLRVPRLFRFPVVSAAVPLLAMACFQACLAGGGPENVFLLVNESSQDSMAVANHYIDLRKIPPSNVLYLKYRGNKAVAKSSVLREQILLPAMEAINSRKLTQQIDYLVYSCDFPWQVDFAQDFPGEKFSPQIRSTASLTGATYLWAFTKEKRKELFGLTTNFYCTPAVTSVTLSRGFRSQYRWRPGGKRAGANGMPYLLSAMLGVTYGRGNTPKEIEFYLRRSSKADGTSPKGTVYFVKNNSPRSKPRHKFFPAAAAELRLTGVRAQVLEGSSLKNKSDVIGMTTGAPQLNLKTSRCRFLPGAFCDNLTSAGGQFYISKKPPGQTCVSEFLRLGAAGACGTVIEPYAIRQKFPLPVIHVHYAHGCSLAEAFYQSVSGPYQQILVGDPLCQPWADQPVVKVQGISDRATVRGTIEILPTATTGKSSGISAFVFFVDGVFAQRCRPNGKLSLDTTALSDGPHELRVVATDSTPIETQGRWIGEVTVKNGRDAIQLQVDSTSLHKKAKQLTVQVVSTADRDIVVMHNGRQLGRAVGGNGKVQIDTARLGTGPITLYALTEGEPGLRSRPLRVELK